MKTLNKQIKKYTIVTYVAIILSASCEILKSYVFGVVFDSIDNKYSMKSIIFLAGFFIISLILTSFFKSFIIQHSRKKYHFMLNDLIVKNFLELTPSKFNQNYTTSEFVNMLNTEVEEVVEKYYINKINIFYHIASFLAGCIYVGLLNIYILVFLIFTVLLCFFINSFFNKKIEKHNETFLNQKKNWIYFSKELSQNQNTIKNYRIEPLMHDNFNLFNKNFVSSIFNKNMILRTASTLSGIFINAIFLSSQIIGIYFVKINLLTLGNLMSILQTSNMLINPLFAFVDLINEKYSIKFLLVKFNNLISQKTNSDNKLAKENITFDKSITLENVEKDIQNKIILKYIDINIEKGKKYFLVGKSGAGKSTLLKILTKNIEDYSGKIFIDDTHLLKDINFNQWNKNYIYVEQSEKILPLTLKENIILDKEYNEKKLDEILKLTNLYTYKNRVDELFLEDNYQFSGGEIQRILLARAFYNLENEQILILDEPFSALDADNGKQILNYINNLNNTVIFVSHTLSDEISNTINEKIYI